MVHSVVGLKITFKSFLTFKTTVAQSITFLLLLVALLFCKGVRYSLLLIRTDPVLQLFPGFFSFFFFFLLFFCTVPLSFGNWLDSLLTRGKKTLLWSQSVVQEPWHRGTTSWPPTKAPTVWCCTVYTRSDVYSLHDVMAMFLGFWLSKHLPLYSYVHIYLAQPSIPTNDSLVRIWDKKKNFYQRLGLKSDQRLLKLLSYWLK